LAAIDGSNVEPVEEGSGDDTQPDSPPIDEEENTPPEEPTEPEEPVEVEPPVEEIPPEEVPENQQPEDTSDEPEDTVNQGDIPAPSPDDGGGNTNSDDPEVTPEENTTAGITPIEEPSGDIDTIEDDPPLLTPEDVAEIERKEAAPSAQPTDGNDILIGTNEADFIVGSIGADIGRGLGGDDEYFWENKEGNISFRVEDNGGALDILNIVNQSPESIEVMALDNGDIQISLDGGSSVTLANQLLDPQIELIRFDDGTVFNQQDLLGRIDGLEQ